MRVVTWNMQGSNAATEAKWQTGVLNLMSSLHCHVICLQECGLVPPSAPSQSLYNAAGNPVIPFVGAVPAPHGFGGIAVPAVPGVVWAFLHGFTVSYHTWGTARRRYHIFHMLTDTGAFRVNLAIVSRLLPTHFLSAAPGLVGARPAIGVRIAYLGTIWDIFTLHAWANGGNDAANLLANILAVGGANCAMLGDFNREPPAPWVPRPAHAAKPRIAIPGATFLCSPHAATRLASGRLLDYMVKSGAQVDGVRCDAIHMSDHKAVIYEI
jgi:cytolethal distending toxin subunit B